MSTFAKRMRMTDELTDRRISTAAANDMIAAGVGALRTESTFSVPGLVVSDHFITVPLVHGSPAGAETLEVFVRELVQPSVPPPRGSRPALLYLQGGPGHEGPRPTEASAWLKAAVNHFRVLLLDQRGTGRSAPVTAASLQRRGSPQQQAEYLTHFRADSIVRDAEVVREALVPKDMLGGRWTILGQSFGGFCCITYLSIAPQGLVEVLLTGGLPPGIDQPCAAHTAYRSLYPKVMRQNERYYQRFPGDVAQVHRIVRQLQSLPDGCAQLPSLGVLRPRGLQLLGMAGLGMGGGFERLHYLLESAFDADGHLSITFLRGYEAWISFDTNPLYLVLHESIYCQGAASNWAAHAVRQEEPFAMAFDAVAAAEAGRPVYFTGETVFPWMLEDFTALAPMREAAELLAAKADWPPLYDLQMLAQSPVRTASATYYEDMYVSFELAQQTAARIHSIQQWITNEYMHSGVRDDGSRILEQLLGMVRGTTLTFE